MLPPVMHTTMPSTLNSLFEVVAAIVEFVQLMSDDGEFACH